MGFTTDSPSAKSGAEAGLPAGWLNVDGQRVRLVALPLLFQLYSEGKKLPTQPVARELLELARSYNPIPPGQEDAYLEAILVAYRQFLQGGA